VFEALIIAIIDNKLENRTMICGKFAEEAIRMMPEGNVLVEELDEDWMGSVCFWTSVMVS